ncbi:MAG: ORF6N domain-containing protein [Treponema sp.]|nr:ORF6N domain-containing protein [Treponema sp.]
MQITNVDSKIIEIRKTKVLLDSDVASLYGVETKRVNEAVRNNPDKFPKGYIIAINKKEKSELVEIFDRFSSLKHSSAPIKAFTEKGLYMLATILKSPQAAKTTLAIIETFTKIRELTRTIGELANKSTKEEKQPLMQKSGEIISDILGDSLNISETETTFGINLAVMNIKHTVKRNKAKTPGSRTQKSIKKKP